MRFIRKEHIITTICNEDVHDDDSIKNLLSVLKDNRLEFSVTYRKYFSSMGDYKNISYSKARIANVSDNVVDFTIFDRGSVTKIPNISFQDITEINATTMVDNIVNRKPDATRWDFLDIGE